MKEAKKFLLRGVSGDQPMESEQEAVDLFLQGKCRGGDFLYDYTAKVWKRVCDLAQLQEFFQGKPAAAPAEKKVIYYQEHDPARSLRGPYSLKEMQEKLRSHEISEKTWIFVDGDKAWRQILEVKVLRDALPALPVDLPELPASQSTMANLSENTDSADIKLEMESNEPYVEREESTMAISALGLSAQMATPSIEPKKVAPPPIPKIMPPVANKPVPMPASASAADLQKPEKNTGTGSYDGLTAEIPTEPIWLIKQGNSELISGPFPFLEVAKFLEQGKVTKNDKISRIGLKSFVKIAQQYEFNVKYSLETVIENGEEKQKIYIRRRHPRVPYMANVQVLNKGVLLNFTCVNISAGGILMEAPKGDFELGDTVEVKILPAHIKQIISCNAVITGKIPKIPPGFSLNFIDLRPADKEAIEFFVQEAMKREQAKP